MTARPSHYVRPATEHQLRSTLESLTVAIAHARRPDIPTEDIRQRRLDAGWAWDATHEHDEDADDDTTE